MKITSQRTPGLGDTTYLLTHDGIGLVIDPQRDVDRFLQAVSDSGVELRLVLETHVHNDYVSGGRSLAERGGAELVVPAAAGVAFDHRPAFHQEDIVLGDVRVRPIHTPGHTPEHMSYAVIVDGHPVALFSGGSLLVGSAGRPDLLGTARAEQLARLQYGSVRRLAELPENTGLYPTHGEGSFCSATSAGRATSTIGAEKRTNPVLQYPDADAFVKGQLAGLQPYPTYYSQMGPINLMGPSPLPSQRLPTVAPDAVPDGAALVDIRPRVAQAAGRIPGAVPLETSDEVGVWSGWVLPFDQPIVLVAEPDQDIADVVPQFGRIGFDHVVGVLRDVAGWADRHGPLQTHRQIHVDDFVAAVRTDPDLQILDVRAPNEWELGRVDGAAWCYVPDLWAGAPLDLDPDRDVYVICRSGYRATAAVAPLIDRGYAPVVVTGGGVAEALTQLRAG
jgi:glyoxylase-like metal-dependent hydrolase (beta-lactamase superfamily II)/rhodanese-related sulfurtransferase